MLQKPSALGLRGIEPVVHVAVVGPGLLHVADGEIAHHRCFLIAAEAPDGFDTVMLGERLAQLRGATGDEVNDSGSQIAGVEDLVEITDDERIIF